MIFRIFLVISALIITIQDPARADSPEGKISTGSSIMAVTAHPQATQTAYDILKAGGTAADAAIAAQMVLGLVEPQSSGLGGGAFVLYYDAKIGQLFSLDGQVTAPLSAGEYLFNSADEAIPKEFAEAAYGGLAVGTPGILKMLEQLYNWQGKTPWADLFAPAIRLAEDGFTVTPRLSALLNKERDHFDSDTLTKLYFFPDSDTPLDAGSNITNSEYATTLNYIATQGVQGFYNDVLGRNLVDKVRKNSNSGLLAIEDLQSYSVKERKPVCGLYRGYKICSMGQPSSGGLALLQILAMLERFDLASMKPKDPQTWHIIAEASRLAFADRNFYMADPDFVATPDEKLLDPNYIKIRSALIDPNRPLLDVKQGVLKGWTERAAAQEKDTAMRSGGGTHMSIVDRYGNILSMSSSLENVFGARIMIDGYLLNNQLTEFSFKSYDAEGNPIANRAQAGKRPRSAMMPTLIFTPDNKPYMVIGTGGGGRSVGYILQQIVNVIDWKMSIEESLKQPHILHQGEKLELEVSGMEMAEGLKNHGHPVLVGDMSSSLNIIQFTGTQMIGVSDPRREGQALGE